MVIRATAIIDTKGITDTFELIESEINAALAGEGDRFLTLYEATVSNWKKKPVFQMIVETRRSEASVVVGTDNDIYRFLHDGTKERWALMSDDFQPKTHPRILGVGPGQGRLILRGRGGFARAGRQDPQPGIKAREWTQEIIKRESAPFARNMQLAFDRAVQKGGAQVP
jgi:hypothetical protein